MSDDELRASPLAIATTEELLEELEKRHMGQGARYGMIVITGRPTEGDPESCDGFITTVGDDPGFVAYLVSRLVDHFQLFVNENGEIGIPEISFEDYNRDG